MTNGALWTPTPERVSAAAVTRFRHRVNDTFGLSLTDYDALYRWSVDEIELFWGALWEFVDIRCSSSASTVLPERKMPGADWFPGARLNFAENLLRGNDADIAIVHVHESGLETRIPYGALRQRVACLAAWLRANHVGVGDRVAAFLPNCPEAIIGMLAASSVGAIWSSCSPDFGFQGVMDRFGQIKPKVLVACNGYHYGTKQFDTRAKVEQLTRALPELEQVVWVHGMETNPPSEGVLWDDLMVEDPAPLTFEQLPFDHPLYIMYSSGTTGVPKCIVHGAGGTLLQHAKEHILHSDMTSDDVLFYFTTTGWMMWNWLASALFTGGTIVLYDGSPGVPSLNALWEMAARLQVTHFGTSPKFLSSCKKSGLIPKDVPELAVRCVMSTGAPLSEELFHWVHDAVGPDVQLASICGGTDIISCFMLGCPVVPVFSGEIQRRGLGMRVEAFSDLGTPLTQEKGELVCTEPFVSMPVGFWNDPDHVRYHNAYFGRFDGIWHHGDFVEITENQGVRVFGRSDATLNPGGIRIGTAEIDRQVEQMPEVLESLVVGQQWREDTRVVLFVVLTPGNVLDDTLTDRIRTRIRKNTTPRHVPARVLQAPAIPRTISGKKVEIAVTRILHGEDVPNRDALANPDALDYFNDAREQLQS